MLRLSVLLFCGFLWAAPPDGIEREFDVRIRMRDGVELSANIFRPVAAGHVPTILVRTPYDKGDDLTPNYRAFVVHGYAVVVQDVRGRYDSQGVFEPLRQEAADSEDTLNWIARQGWSNRRIGMMGGSYVGIVQWKSALLNNPYLKAIFPVVAGCDDYFDRFYSFGGTLKLGQRLEWMSENLRAPDFPKPDFNRFVLNLPLRTSDRLATGRTVGFYQRALDHPAYDSFWKNLSTRERIEHIHVPVFSVGGWYDNFVESDLEAFRLMRKNGRIHRILIGPWPHNMSYSFPGVNFGPEGKLPILGLQLEWFDYWLKREPGPNSHPSVASPPARIFIMGANRWRDEEEWPLSRARLTPFYLSSRGRANSLDGDGRLQPGQPRGDRPDQFVYDPANPAPTAGGAVCCNPRVFPWGPVDQRPVEKRRDVLVYTSSPLKRELEVTGPVRVVLYVSTSQPDTDFTAKLVDVFPDGRAINLTDGILRLRYRESLEKPMFAHPGQVYPIAIDAGVTSNQFGKGHRIRVEISSSSFPRFDRNPNTGRPVADEKELWRASQTVFHDRQRPSHIVLPVIPN
ncbi:MAG: CocE/NonD family hydrolase [Bryobacteraceae bacterium]|jgi:putative CocE/NonD family hydrolase